MKLKARADIDNDNFVSSIDSFLKEIEPEAVLNQMKIAVEAVSHKGHLNSFMKNLELYEYSLEEYIEIIKNYVSKDLKNKNSLEIMGIIEKGLSLYNLNGPLVLLASDYGVPQKRERVIFLGSRNDQKEVCEITKTTPSKEDKVSIFEAIFDLDNIGINETVYGYDELLKDAKDYYKDNKHIIKTRAIDGVETSKTKGGKTYSEWSRQGRLIPKFKQKKPLFCSNYNDFVSEEERSNLEFETAELFNHQTSNHNPDVQKRLEIIRKSGDYKFATKALKTNDVLSKKRNYNVLLPTEQSTTIMTIADDYIHYRSNRAPTVREMARLQSFDDSFVFQGKRTTGGDRRKDETPQFTMVGNAVPPLMARAIATEILCNIK
jgi:DNA (cytosine-5)-methyltransferase 1